MVQTTNSLFEDQIPSEGDIPTEGYGRFPTGIIPSHILRRETRAKRLVVASDDFEESQIQPASIDLRLGDTAYRVRASFLPGKATVREKLAATGFHEIDIRDGAVLETGCVYIVPLQESVKFTKRVSGATNPKSSTGRLDVFTRVITDRAQAFDRVEEGYSGPLFAEINPRTFPILVRKGSRLSQLRIRSGSKLVSDTELKRLSSDYQLTDGKADINEGLAFTVDLRGEGPDKPVGYRAKRHSGFIDIDKPGAHDPQDFWDPIFPTKTGELVLDPNEFYILVSRESLAIPPDYAAEMVPFNPLVGEFRVHYAGFFDPGFGYEPGKPPSARGVLEVRSREVPFILEDGQIVGRLVFERLTDPPPEAYGQGIGSNYQRQGLKLSKHFREPR
jgi:dCTP deaminase